MIHNSYGLCEIAAIESQDTYIVVTSKQEGCSKVTILHRLAQMRRYKMITDVVGKYL